MQGLDTAELGRRLASARVYAGINQAEIVRRAKSAKVKGLSQTSLSNIENGVTVPSAEAVRWLCTEYGRDVQVVLDPEYEPFVDPSASIRARLDELTEAVAALAGKSPSSPPTDE